MFVTTLKQRQRAPSPTQLGFTRVGHIKLSKSDISDFDRERVGVRGYGLSLGCNPSPGSHRTTLRVADPIRPLPMGEVALNSRGACRAVAGLNGCRDG